MCDGGGERGGYVTGGTGAAEGAIVLFVFCSGAGVPGVVGACVFLGGGV